jgi:hypothetical protein
MKISQPSLFGPPVGGKIGTNHPATAVAAAHTVKAGTQHALIVKELSLAPGGLTAYDLADGRVKNAAGRPISPNQIATRLLELRERGFVEYTFEERETTPGNTGMVQRLTVLGIIQAWKIDESAVNAQCKQKEKS